MLISDIKLVKHDILRHSDIGNHLKHSASHKKITLTSTQNNALYLLDYCCTISCYQRAKPHCGYVLASWNVYNMSWSRKKRVLFVHENVRPNAELMARDIIRPETHCHPPYSPELESTFYQLIHSLDKYLHWESLSNEVGLRLAFTDFLTSRNPDLFTVRVLCNWGHIGKWFWI